MSKHPNIATEHQEQHMRTVLAKLQADSGDSLSAFSQRLIGSIRLLDFQRGERLTSTLLTRIVIGLKAQGTPFTREALLGPKLAPQAPPVAAMPYEEKEDPLNYCVGCLTKNLTALCEASQQLTTVVTTLSKAIEHEFSLSVPRLLPVVAPR